MSENDFVFAKRAVRGLKHIGRIRYRHGDDRHPLDCLLAGRVSRVFCTGMTRAIELCRMAGEDPEYREVHEEDVCECGCIDVECSECGAPR